MDSKRVISVILNGRHVIFENVFHNGRRSLWELATLTGRQGLG